MRCGDKDGYGESCAHHRFLTEYDGNRLEVTVVPFNALALAALLLKVEPVGEFALKGIRRPLAAYNVLSAATAET